MHAEYVKPNAAARCMRAVDIWADQFNEQVLVFAHAST